MTTSTDRKGPNIKAILIISIGVALNTALAAQMALIEQALDKAD